MLRIICERLLCECFWLAVFIFWHPTLWPSGAGKTLKLDYNLKRGLQMNPAGLEPAIPSSVGRCLIHWATGPDVDKPFPLYCSGQEIGRARKCLRQLPPRVPVLQCTPVADAWREWRPLTPQTQHTPGQDQTGDLQRVRLTP